MPPEILKYLFDIQESIGIIEAHLQTVPDLTTYKTEIKTIDAVERRLAIIGEALNKYDMDYLQEISPRFER